MTVTFTVLSSLPPPSSLRACHPCQSFLLSLIQFLCSQIRPQPTKIWVSKIFLAPLQPPSFQQEPAAQAGSKQAASSSPHLVVLSIGGKKITDIQDLGANKLSWCYLANITCWYPWQAYFFRYAVFIHFFIWVFQLPPFPPREKNVSRRVFIALNRKREYSKEDLQGEGIWHYLSTLHKILQRNWLFWATVCSLFCSHLWKLY